MDDHQRCMNCGAGLKGPYCHVCGQRDDDFRRPFLALGTEFIGDVFAFDSRIFRSVPPFLVAPGSLTRSFMKGKRGKYVSPLRLYFVITLIFFAVLAATDVAIFKVKVDADRLESLSAVVTDEMAAEQARDVQDRVADARRRALEQASGVVADLEKGAQEAPASADTSASGTPAPPRSSEELERRLRKELTVDGSPVDIAFFSHIEANESFDGLPANWKEDLARKIDESEGTEKQKNRLRRYVAAVELALVNPRAFNQIFNTWIPRILIVVVPLFALLTSFLYGRKKRLPRRVYYIDHLVFSIYFHSFLFFLMLLLVLKAEWIGNVWDGSLTAQVFFLVIALYLFVGMKQAFGQGYIKTSVKFVFLYSFYFVTMAMALITLLVVGVLSLPVTTPAGP